MCSMDKCEKKNEFQRGSKHAINYVLKGNNMYPVTIVREKESYNVYKYKGFKLFYDPSVNWKTLMKKRFRAVISDFEEVGPQFLITSITNMFHMFSKFFTVCRNIQNKSGEFSIRLAKIATLFHNVCLPSTYYSTPMTITILIERLLDLYIVFADIRDIVIPQSLGTLIFSTALSFIPKELQLIITRLNSFANTKFLEDIGIWHSICVEVIKYVGALVDLFAPTSIRVHFDSFVKFLDHHVLLEESKYYIKLFKESKSFADEAFRIQLKDFVGRLSANEVLVDWARSSSAVKDRITKIQELYKACLNFEHTSRMEPICIGFEGPAGCGKSTIMANLMKALKYPVYNHLLPTVDKGDWYDHYPEASSSFFALDEEGKQKEHFMMLDDVGQNGPSQYAPFMNLISSIKMPLPCAEASKKDTRFFQSTGVIFTTNKFKGIQLIRSDGIDDIKALYRRVFLFTFKNAGPYKSGLGSIVCEHFDTVSESWIEGPPRDIKLWMKKKDFSLTHSINLEDENAVLEWLAKWVVVSRRAKTMNLESTLNTNIDLTEALSVIPQEDSFLDFEEENPEDPGFEWWLWDYVKYYTSKVVNKLSELSHNSIFWLLALLVPILIYKFKQSRYDEVERQSMEALMMAGKNGSTQANKIKSQMGILEFSSGASATCVASGHYLITISHVSQKEEEVVTFYKDKLLNIRYLDKVKVRLVYNNVTDDVSIWAIDSFLLTPFSKLKFLFAKYNPTELKRTWLITPQATIPLTGIARLNEKGANYTVHGVKFSHPPQSSISYPYEGVGMCGSVVFDDDNGFIGIHFAKSAEKGLAKIFSQNTIEDIKKIIISDTYNMPSDQTIAPIGENSSGVQLYNDISTHSPKNNSVVPGPLYGVYEPATEPANFLWDGNHTVVTLARESLKPVNKVNEEDLEFAMQAMRLKMAKYNPLTESETIKGTTVIAGLDLQTSSGFECENKNELVDKEGGKLTELGRQRVEDLKRVVDAEEVDIRTILTVETLKAEARPLKKAGKPRTFRVLRFPINYELKRLTGQLVEHFVTHMWHTGICVGLNPYKHFDRLRSELCEMNVLASDVGSWDKNMVPEVQYAMRDLLLEFFVGNDKDRELLGKLLTMCISTVVQANNQTFVTTHSMPSGCYLTALGNSIVHQFYTLMFYHRVYPEHTVFQALNNIKDFVMGDDKICGVKKELTLFNAITMEKYFNELGLELSSFDKTKIVNPYDSLDEVEFLKRSFWYHPKLQKYVGKLSDKTLLSTINFVDKTKELSDTIHGKLVMFQIENYLHYDKYKDRIDYLERFCEKRDIPFTRLTEEYIYNLFIKGEVPYKYEISGFVTF